VTITRMRFEKVNNLCEGGNLVNSMVLKTGPGKEPEKGVVPVSLVRPGSDRWSNR
jgi:hypothetical protein